MLTLFGPIRRRSDGFFQGTTGVPAIAREFHGASCILAVLTTVFAAFPGQAIASWMSALFVVLHDEIMGSWWANLRKFSNCRSVRAVTRAMASRFERPNPAGLWACPIASSVQNRARSLQLP